MTGPDYEKSIVALVCWARMKTELYRGTIAVAHVLRNRAAADWFEGSIYLNAVADFPEAIDGLLEHPDVRDPEFQKLLLGIDKLFAGQLTDKTDGAMYFTKASSEDTIAGTVTTKIGQTIFFK